MYTVFMNMRFIIVAAAVLAVVASATLQSSTVTMPDGPIAGSFNPKSGIYSFKGIPYAQPPIGDLRFADTVAVTPWTATRPATNFSAGCMAVCRHLGFSRPRIMCADTISEDCLYVNVYSPNVTVGAPLLPVIFFIHGGNYVSGAGGVLAYDGTSLARTAKAVIVTINYRLNVFGGLYTGDVVNGNYQTKDQREAMRWTQRNIAAFGGDKDRVTISGQSAGAFSVAVHLSSPLSKDLFKQAIIVSDPIALPASTKFDALDLGVQVLKNLSCSLLNQQKQLACLRAAPAAVLLALEDKEFPLLPSDFLAEAMRWVPVVTPGEAELPLAPVVALSTGKWAHMPVMYGTVRNESVEFIHGISKGPLPAKLAPLLLDVVFGKDSVEKITKMYGAPPAAQKDDCRPWLSFVATDYIFYCATRYVGGMMSKVAPVFVYYYDYLMSDNAWVFGKYMPFCVENVCHAEDLIAIFFPFEWITMPSGDPKQIPTAADKYVANTVQSAWGNFVHTGNPNPLPAKGAEFVRFNATLNQVVKYGFPTTNMVGFHSDKCDAMDTFASPPYTRR
jgi:acetylcholinesterase/cholinesterase